MVAGFWQWLLLSAYYSGNVDLAGSTGYGRNKVVVDRVKNILHGWYIFTLVVLTVPYMDVDIDMLVKGLQRFMQSKGILFY